MNKNSFKYSIVIPTFNEEETIKEVLTSLDQQTKIHNGNVEIIIADGYSEDQTINLCKEFDVKIVYSSKGRGIQMNKGAEIASGDILVFLHADTFLPKNSFENIENILNNESKIVTFRLKFDKDNFLYRLYSFFSKFDSIFTTFGDQVIIIREDFFKKLNGFKNQKIMEDVDLFKRARKVTKINKINKFVITSSRKFENEGLIKTQIKNFFLITKYIFGTSPEDIYQSYYNEKKKRDNRIRKISGAWQSKN